MTPPFKHESVLLPEVVQALPLRTGGRYADLTLGGGGHAEAILEATAPTGWLLGVDLDPAALAASTRRLAPYAGRFLLQQGPFTRLGEWVPDGSLDAIVADLGVSSHQLDTPERGFSLAHDGPLDMRLAPDQGSTAAELVNGLSPEELADLFFKLGDERHARRIARAIVHEREVRPLTSTRQLADLIERLVPRRGSAVHPATQVFMALRLAVNDEPRMLERGLHAAWQALRRQGRLLVITFHGGEVRRVRQFGRALDRDYEVPDGVDVPELRRPRPPQLRWLHRRPVVPGEAELARNPRSRSAQLRVMEKLVD